MTNLLNTIKAYFAPTPEAEEETPVGIAAVTETDQWDYILFGNK